MIQTIDISNFFSEFLESCLNFFNIYSISQLMTYTSMLFQFKNLAVAG